MSSSSDPASRELSAEAISAAAREIVTLAVPHLAAGGKTLAYILPQSARIGHFGLETQIIATLFEDAYDRILIFTDKMSMQGTNPWIRACVGPKFRFIEVDNFDILLLGMRDAGLHHIGPLDCLFIGPRSLFIRFYRHILAGGAVKPLTLPEEAEGIARDVFNARGIDPDAPFVFFHNRTLAYVSNMTYHAYRTATVEAYKPSIARLIDAGYRVVRIGEPGLSTMGFPPDLYVNIPEWGAVDRAVDLFVLARNAFGLAQNSGPIWVAAAFGRQVLRTNAPFEHMNMPYNDDLTLFKHYHAAGSPEPLRYRQILEAGIPAMVFSEAIAEAGFEVVENTPDELLSATEEMLTRVAGTWERDTATDRRFQALGAEYEARLIADPEMQKSNFAFYGYAHPFGSIARVTLDAQPGFLD